jgi:hypothetical protein
LAAWHLEARPQADAIWHLASPRRTLRLKRRPTATQDLAKLATFSGSVGTLRAVKHTRLLAVGVIFAVVAAACGGGSAETTTTTALTTLPPVTDPPATTTSTSTTTTTTTTTTIPPVAGDPSPLNGLPVEDLELLDRRVVAVKMDNHPDARPQSGIQEADAVFELLVEAGLTRFIGLFLQSDSEYYGPIRSLRPTDPTLVKPLGATLQISGGQSWVQSVATNAGVRLLGESSPNTFRVRNGRVRERTLYGSTVAMREVADGRGYSDDPPASPMFEFGEPAPSTTSATEITLDWSDFPVVRWVWDGEQYLRFNAQTPHNWLDVDGDEEQISTDVLVVLTATKYTASPSSGSGSSVPAMTTVGTGQALLFSGGVLVEGTWERAGIDLPFELSLADGSVMTVPAGRLWVSIFPTNRTLSWE